MGLVSRDSVSEMPHLFLVRTPGKRLCCDGQQAFACGNAFRK